ncbi:unnamed protein product [Thlaspi arvense]|uniref:Uncharacterized protein n=1 Tax=Thlaspi arvense TaxID=13288 RepID=A0AAU9RQK3_THLAR|nr:unnamed protein product [Thlaspi arvense]
MRSYITYTAERSNIKIKDLTLETKFSPFVVPSINRLLQDSPELKKLTVHVMESGTLPIKTSNIVYGKLQPKNVNCFI